MGKKAEVIIAAVALITAVALGWFAYWSLIPFLDRNNSLSAAFMTGLRLSNIPAAALASVCLGTSAYAHQVFQRPPKVPKAPKPAVQSQPAPKPTPEPAPSAPAAQPPAATVHLGKSGSGEALVGTISIPYELIADAVTKAVKNQLPIGAATETPPALSNEERIRQINREAYEAEPSHSDGYTGALWNPPDQPPQSATSSELVPTGTKLPEETAPAPKAPETPKKTEAEQAAPPENSKPKSKPKKETPLVCHHGD